MDRGAIGEPPPRDEEERDYRSERLRHGVRLLALAALGCAVLWAALFQPVAVADALAWGESLAAHPITIPLLILIQALLLSLALPGTLMLWMVAPFYGPLMATGILTAGSVLGAFGAYHTAGWLGRHWRPGPTGRGVLRLLKRQGDLWTQLALRVFPGFPHSVVNFGAGTLALPMAPFLAAALIGLGVKWLVYTLAVQALLQPGAQGEAIDPAVLLPLAALAVLLVGGRWVRGRLK